MSGKPEFPPLLAPGLHPYTLSSLRELCVAQFPLSQTRKPIMTGLETVIGKLVDCGCHGDLWVNGSFLTLAIDPSDSDVILHVPFTLHSASTQEQLQVLAWFSRGGPEAYLCDAYIRLEYPRDHRLYWDGQERLEYWTKQYGESCAGVPKGIAVVHLPSGAV